MISKLPPHISKQRKEIEKIYDEILSLLKKRLRLISKIKKEKEKLGIPFIDLKQEEKILKKSGRFRKVFKEIIKDK